ncbi:hypothetical protein OROHE_022896 [Orobanche hederae]
MLDSPLNLCTNGRKFWGWFLLVIGSFSFVGFAYAAVISKLLPPSSNIFVSAIENDRLIGSITIYYFAKEEVDRRVAPLFPETYVPIKIPFRKGLHQEFRQPSGTGFDLRFFAMDDLSNPSSRDDVFLIVISADTCLSPYIIDDRSYLLSHTLPQMQITQVALPKNNEGQFIPKVVRQLLWTDDTCYELREIYGLEKSGKECVVCMSEPKDIALLPCRDVSR